MPGPFGGKKRRLAVITNPNPHNTAFMRFSLVPCHCEHHHISTTPYPSQDRHPAACSHTQGLPGTSKGRRLGIIIIINPPASPSPTYTQHPTHLSKQAMASAATSLEAKEEEGRMVGAGAPSSTSSFPTSSLHVPSLPHEHQDSTSFGVYRFKVR